MWVANADACKNWPKCNRKTQKRIDAVSSKCRPPGWLLLVKGAFSFELKLENPEDLPTYNWDFHGVSGWNIPTSQDTRESGSAEKVDTPACDMTGRSSGCLAFTSHSPHYQFSVFLSCMAGKRSTNTTRPKSTKIAIRADKQPFVRSAKHKILVRLRSKLI